MRPLNPEAEALNQTIQENNSNIYSMLSEKGKRIFFPKKGLVQQGLDAKGKDINATIGMAIEDDRTPMRLSAIAESMSLPPAEAFPYAPSYGIPDLRKQWQSLIAEKNPSLKSKMTLPVITCGLTHGLSVIGYLFTDPGDNIIVPSMYWGNYRLVFEEAYDVKLDPFNVFNDNGFDTESLRKKLSESTGKQLLLLNFPHNPTGYTPTVEEAETIINIIRESAESGNRIAVIQDDAYFGLVYEQGIYTESLFGKLADLHENVLSIKIDGATKEDYAWGFRVGFITYAYKGISDSACKAMEGKTAGRVRGNVSNVPHISQSYLLKAMRSPDYREEKKKKYELLKNRYDRVKVVMDENQEKFAPFFRPLPYNSGYFMCIALQGDIDAESVRQSLLSGYDTGVVALKDVLRIAFSSVSEKNIPGLFDNIYEVCRKMKSNS